MGGLGREGDGADLIELLFIVAEGDGGEDDDFCVCFVGDFGGGVGEVGGFVDIGTVGEVVVVGFGGAPGEDGDIGWVIEELAVIGFEGNIGTRGHWVFLSMASG